MLSTYIPQLTCIRSNLLLSHISLILLCRFWSLIETKEHVAKCYRQSRKWAVYFYPFVHSYLVYLFISVLHSQTITKTHDTNFLTKLIHTDSKNKPQEKEGQFIVAGPLFLITEATIATDRQALHFFSTTHKNKSNNNAKQSITVITLPITHCFSLYLYFFLYHVLIYITWLLYF